MILCCLSFSGKEEGKKNYQKPKGPSGREVSPGDARSRAGIPGDRGDRSRRVLAGRWRGKQTCVLVTWAGWDVWPRLSTKTTWHLGHGAGIPVSHGVPEVLTVHGSTAGRDWPHPSLWPAPHPAGLTGAEAGLGGTATSSTWHNPGSPWTPGQVPGLGGRCASGTERPVPCPAPGTGLSAPVGSVHQPWCGAMPGCDAEGGSRAKNKVELLWGHFPIS